MVSVLKIDGLSMTINILNTYWMVSMFIDVTYEWACEIAMKCGANSVHFSIGSRDLLTPQVSIQSAADPIIDL